MMNLEVDAQEAQAKINDSLISINAELTKVLKQIDEQLAALTELATAQSEHLLNLKRRVEKLEFPNRGM